MGEGGGLASLTYFGPKSHAVSLPGSLKQIRRRITCCCQSPRGRVTEAAAARLQPASISTGGVSIELESRERRRGRKVYRLPQIIPPSVAMQKQQPPSVFFPLGYLTSVPDADSHLSNTEHCAVEINMDVYLKMFWKHVKINIAVFERQGVSFFSKSKWFRLRMSVGLDVDCGGDLIEFKVHMVLAASRMRRPYTWTDRSANRVDQITWTQPWKSASSPVTAKAYVFIQTHKNGKFNV